MKKIVVMVGLLLFGSVFASAQSGLNVGDTVLSFSLGIGNATNTVEGYDWGDNVALSYGGQVMKMVSPFVGLGVELNGNNFASVNNSQRIYIQSQSYLETVYCNVDIWNLMLAGKFYLSPIESSGRVYIPLGVGIGFSDIDINYSIEGTGSLHDKSSKVGVAWHAGFGFEGDMTDNLIFGLEARFSGTRSKVDLLDKNTNLIHFQVAARLGYKF